MTEGGGADHRQDREERGPPPPDNALCILGGEAETCVRTAAAL